MSHNQYARTGRMMIVFTWLIFFGILFLFFYSFNKEQVSDYQVLHGRIEIDANHQGHYLIPGKINQYPVQFMLDTGATLVAVPQELADRMHLKGRYPVNIHTANGEVTGLLTRLEELSFGKFTIKNVKAVIIPSETDKTVLMGMNVLGQFDMNQKDRKLIISR